MEIKQQKNDIMINKENIFESLQFALNFFDWSEKEKAKRKWLKLLERAINGDNDSYEFLISQNGISEFNGYLSSFFKKFEKKMIAVKRYRQIENYLKSYLCNNLVARGQYNSLYFYNNYKMMRISDHFSVPRNCYIKINKRIYINFRTKYECDIVFLIPNFFNANRKKRALLLILEKKINLILEKFKKKGHLLDKLPKPTTTMPQSKFTHNFYENLNNQMIFFKKNSTELNIFKYINN